jgi:tetratricopeptide (TPR) repeat protein
VVWLAAVLLFPGEEIAGRWKALGMEQVKAGRLEAAAEAFREACRLDEKEPDACYYLGRALYVLGRYGEAKPPLRKALNAAPEEERWRVHRALARNHEALAEYGEAEKRYREAIRLAGGRAGPEEDPRIDYGSFLYRMGRLEEALKPLQEAVRAHPASARARTELGRVHLQADRLAEAAQELQKAVELDPRAWNARLLLGRAWVRMGRVAEGEKQLRLGQQGQGSSTVR